MNLKAPAILGSWCFNQREEFAIALIPSGALGLRLPLMPWFQDYMPIGGRVSTSAFVAVIPLVVLFGCLAVVKMKAHWATLFAAISAMGIAFTVWKMPAHLVLLSAAQGAGFGLFPVLFIVLSTLILYELTVKGGQFEIIRASIAAITPDKRLQALLIAFCFGAFIEGAAGFGAPVAIAAATLVGLGFAPLEAAGICLIANTAPVAFGTIGIPIIAMAGTIGLDEHGIMKLSAMVGRQLPFISLIIPFYMVTIMVGYKRSIEVLPAVMVCGLTFAGCQAITANTLGPYLPDLIASLASMGALLLLLKFWKPKKEYTADRNLGNESNTKLYSRRQVLSAWAPYFVLTVCVLVWGLGPVKNVLGSYTLFISVPSLDKAIAKGVASAPILLAAKFKFDWLASGGTAVFIAALISAYLCGISLRELINIIVKTLMRMMLPALTVSSVLALAYVMNNSGMTTSLGLYVTQSGHYFPLLAPVVGWIGVLLTGSDTSSNVLFGGLQKTAAEKLSISPILTTAANTSGGVMGKMVSPQSLAVACAATGNIGQESSLFRFAIKHSLILLGLMCLIVYLQAYYLSWMIP